MLLEKAYAKIHGSYKRIEYGFPHHAMRDLTGCPSYYYSLTSMNESKIVDLIQEAVDHDYIVAAGTAGYDDLSRANNGIGLV